MKSPFEMLSFLGAACLAILAGSVVIWLAGIPIALSFLDSTWISSIVVCLVFPAVSNFLLMIRHAGGLSNGQRVFAGIRGIGMLLWAAAALVPRFVPGTGLGVAKWLLGTGVLLWFASMLLDDYFVRRSSDVKAEDPSKG